MRQRQGVVGFTVACMFGLLACAGCGSKHSQQVALKYVPAGTGLLSDLKPAVLSLDVVDRRAEAQQENIGVQRNTFWGSKHATVTSKVPEIEVVRDAIETELAGSGHRVVDSGQEPAPMSLRVALTQFLFDSKGTGDMHIELVGIICADVTASVGMQGQRQVSFAVESAYRDFVQMGWIRPMLLGSAGVLFRGNATHKSDIEKTMNGALGEFVRQLCLEPRLRQVFVEAADAQGLSPGGAQTYARQPADASLPVAGNESDSGERERGNQGRTEVQESGWIETISIAQVAPQGVGTASVLHGTRDYLLKFRPDCAVKVSDDPLMQEIAVEKLLQFLQGRQHQFTVRGYVGAEVLTPASSQKLQVLEVVYLESQRGETGAQ